MTINPTLRWNGWSVFKYGLGSAYRSSHSGNIWAESKTGEGSTFWFTLPVRVPH